MRLSVPKASPSSLACSLETVQKAIDGPRKETPRFSNGVTMAKIIELTIPLSHL
jgi:hypothetical protein